MTHRGPRDRRDRPWLAERAAERTEKLIANQQKAITLADEQLMAPE